MLGPMFAEATKRAIGWPMSCQQSLHLYRCECDGLALSASPKRSDIVPATLQRAVAPAAPQRNWKMILHWSVVVIEVVVMATDSMGKLRARAVP